MKEHMTGIRTYPGYPKKRLVMENLDETTNLTLPDGEWSTGVHIYPSLQEQDRLREQGYGLDDFGRPLHPWLREMLGNPDIGVLTGMGEFWHWGPNRTGDPVIIGDGKVLLIKRSDTGAWALPGGFVNPDETGRTAARRELFEETGIMVAGEGHEVYDGPVADARTTAHAWPETTAVVWRVNGTPDPAPSDDAIDAKWFLVDQLPSELHGSHLLLIQKAVEKVDALSAVPAFSLPEKTSTFRAATGGHMAYNRFFVTTDEGEIFVKSHDSQAFTDKFREERSRKYLQKEKHVYDHVSGHCPQLLPSFVRMIDDHSLVMEALPAGDGWHWRAPREKIDHYLNEVIVQLQSLQAIPLPAEKFASHMKPTYDTHMLEGWHAIDDAAIQKIIAKLEEFFPKLNSDFQNIAGSLVHALPALHNASERLVDPDEFFFCHHDLRPANLAWHPRLGTRIVDWSWAGAGRKNSDITTLLIDLHKSGHHVQDRMELFNPDHALTLIGFWLAHSLWPTRTADDSVRFHQVVSAISAYDLLMKYRQR